LKLLLNVAHSLMLVLADPDAAASLLMLLLL
jgi:hypothetical protein